MKASSPINVVVIVRADGTRETIEDREFFVDLVTVKFKNRAKGQDCRTEVRR